jgi:hypothetical protein
MKKRISVLGMPNSKQGYFGMVGTTPRKTSWKTFLTKVDVDEYTPPEDLG